MSQAFKYKAYDKGGQLVQGAISSESKDSALLDLKKQGLIPLLSMLKRGERQ